MCHVITERDLYPHMIFVNTYAIHVASGDGRDRNRERVVDMGRKGAIMHMQSKTALVSIMTATIARD